MKSHLHLNIKADWFLTTGKFFSLKNPSFIKINLVTHACVKRNCQLFFILTPWGYSKCKYILHTLTVYKIPAKEHKVVHRWAADIISVS